MAYPLCGNGQLDPGEECDDNNTRDLDECSNQCTRRIGARCGDGNVDRGAGEQCDEGVINGLEPSLCTLDCKLRTVLPTCGNGKIDTDAEKCDNGSANGNYPESSCLANCLLPYCGDGIVGLSEQCDDGNSYDFDGCDHTCLYEESYTAANPLTGNVSGLGQQYYGNIPTPARTPTGPGLVIFLASGAAAGIAFMRRRFRK